MDGLKARLSFDAVAYDYDDEYLTIDTDTHTININNVSRLFGVQYDGNSKLIKFKIRNKLSDIQKMQDSIVYINWIDSRGVKGQSIAINKTINNDTCEFAWKVPFDALKNSGVLLFAMSAVVTKNSSSVIDQRWSTQIASVITPDGIYIKSYTPSSEEEDRIAQIYNELSNMINKQNDNLQSQISQLKEDLDGLNDSVFNVKGKESLSWKIGAVNKADGLDVIVNNRIRCLLFQADGGTVSVSNDYQIAIGVYTGNNINTFDHYVDFSHNEYHFEKGKYYVIVIKENSEKSFVDADITNVSNMITLKYWNGDNNVELNTKNIESIYSSNDSIKKIGFSSNINFHVGGLNPSDGSITDNAERLYSDIIFVRKDSTINLKPNKELKFAVYKYDDLLGDEFISSTALSFDDYIFTEDCYIRVLIESGDTNRLKDINFDLFSFDLNELNNHVKYTELTEWVNSGFIAISDVNDYTKFAIKYTDEWSFMVLPVYSGDKFIVYGYGGNNSRLYTFTDKFGKVLKRTEKTNVLQKIIVTSPSDGYVIFNVLRSREHQVFKFNTNVIIESNKRNLIVPPYMPSAYNPILSVPNSKTTVMNYEEIVESWDKLQKKYPDYISKTNLGKETSGLLDMYRYDFIPEIVPLEASVLDGMNKIYTKNDYPIVIMGACIHGAERPCAKALLNLMTLIADAKDYSVLGWLRNNIHFVIIPLENPWGYKNDKRTNVNQVDLNRNFEPFWEKGDDTTENQRYRGTAPLSEKETQYIDSILKECADKTVCYYSFHTHGVFTSYSKMTNFSSPALFLLNDMQNIGMSVTKMITTSGWTNHNLPEDSGYIGCMEMAYGVAMSSYQGAKYNIPSACPEVMYRYYDGGTGEIYNTDLDCMNTEYILYAVANACEKFLYCD